jgi:hypothetical protein
MPSHCAVTWTQKSCEAAIIAPRKPLFTVVHVIMTGDEYDNDDRYSLYPLSYELEPVGRESLFISPLAERHFQLTGSVDIQHHTIRDGQGMTCSGVSAALAVRKLHDLAGLTGDWIHTVTELSFGRPTKKILTFQVDPTRVTLSCVYR